ncbi:MAG: secondary thiamine-phosphate synthase [Flavobacteriales bacterium]|nr:MAG: secondary thiamine-phosphate synthase [Flavobacteriales bacterium]
MINQFEFSLKEYSRGFHIITEKILNNIEELPETGVLHLFIKHTSAGLTINENADPTVLSDFESSFNHIVKENEPFYKHTFEGSDDMPAHIKSSMVGSSISIPITNHKLNLGAWQGIYLCEFRNSGGSRKLVATIFN